MTEHGIVAAEPRADVQVSFKDGRSFRGPAGTTVQAFCEAAFPDANPPIVAAFVDNQLRELTQPLTRDAMIRPLDISTGDGSRIYQRSLSFLLIVAARELFPHVRIVVDHSLTLNGLFCQVEGRDPFNEDEIAALGGHMRHLAKLDLPIQREQIPLKEAAAIFAEQGYKDKVRLLNYRSRDYLTTYTLRGVRDYFYGYMAPSTGYVRHFGLRHYPPGFILRFPRRSSPDRLPPFRDSPKLAAVFKEYSANLKLLDIENVGGLNQAVAEGRTRELVLVNEALHEQRIAGMARVIANQRGRVRLVLIAGPSASGKTTSTKRLAVELLANGIRPIAIGLDDYFLDRDKTPRDRQGNHRFEDLVAIDRALFNHQLLALMAGEEITLPRYNFVSGRREWGDRLRIGEDHVVLVEGIHGMNPGLVPDIPSEAIYRIYISCLTQLNLDSHNRIPTTDTRLLRRIVRDAQYRGYKAQDTIRQWEHVRAGEGRNIFAYQENADAMFNSALAYELAMLKPLAEPLLREIEPGTMEYAEARRLLTFLRWLLPAEPELIPDNSVLREFIGGSILRDFEPWRSGVRVERE